MNCPRCSAQISPSATVCPQCGERVSSPSPVQVPSAGRPIGKVILVWTLTIVIIAALTTALRLGGLLAIALYAIGFAVAGSITSTMTKGSKAESTPAQKVYAHYAAMSDGARKAAIAEKLRQMGEAEPGATGVAAIMSGLFDNKMFVELSYMDKRQIQNSKNAVAFLRSAGIDAAAELADKH